MAEIIGYKSAKGLFVRTINRENGLSSIIHTLTSNNLRTSEKEANSWKTSLPALANVLNSTKLPQNITIALEYKIPITERRIDALITGYDNQGTAHAVIVEMKAWDAKYFKIKNELVEYKEELNNHPCYQAYSYQQIFNDYNPFVQAKKIILHSLVYMYNMDDVSMLQGKYGIQVFGKGDEQKFVTYLQSFLSKGDKRQVMDELTNAPIVPSLTLRQATQKILEHNFPLLDEQKVVFEEICKAIDENKTQQKKVIAVRGDAGTGKTIIAASLLAKYGKNIQYATPNPFIPTRWIIGEVLDKYHPGAKSQLIDLSDLSKLSIDAQIILIDEAHKLKSVHDIHNIIEKTQICIFFCDPHQITKRYDEGTINALQYEAQNLNAVFIVLDIFTQYRCNGSTQYLNWLYSILELETDLSKFALGKEDYNFIICKSPSEITTRIAKRQDEGFSARVVIGNCYDHLQIDGGNVFNDKHFDWELTDCGRPNIWAKDGNYNHTVGKLFHCAGLEFDYIGVIIGLDLFYKNGNVMADSRNRVLEKDIDFYERLDDMYFDSWFRSEDYIFRIKNLYYTLLTRGMRGCYVYCCDDKLANYFRNFLK